MIRAKKLRATLIPKRAFILMNSHLYFESDVEYLDNYFVVAYIQDTDASLYTKVLPVISIRFSNGLLKTLITV